jgi:hypothetical protein
MARGEFLVRLANLLRPSWTIGPPPAPPPAPLRVRSVAVVTESTHTGAHEASVPCPEIVLEVTLEDGSVFRIHAVDVTGMAARI